MPISVRNYCAENKIEGAYLKGKTWMIPENAQKPIRKNSVLKKPKTLLQILKEQKDIGRLIMFKECLKHNIVPFIIRDENKMFYYRGLS